MSKRERFAVTVVIYVRAGSAEEAQKIAKSEIGDRPRLDTWRIDGVLRVGG